MKSEASRECSATDSPMTCHPNSIMTLNKTQRLLLPDMFRIQEMFGDELKHHQDTKEKVQVPSI